MTNNNLCYLTAGVLTCPHLRLTFLVWCSASYYVLDRALVAVSIYEASGAKTLQAPARPKTLYYALLLHLCRDCKV